MQTPSVDVLRKDSFMNKPGVMNVAARPAARPAVAPQQNVAVLTGARRIQQQLLPIPSPGRGEVLIEIEGCGVCASSLPDWQGRQRTEYPLAAGGPGHEPWGTVVECGPDVSQCRVGQRVAFLSEKGFAQYACARQDQVVELPAELGQMPFPGEAIACAMNIFERSDIQPGHNVAIVGAGFLGLLLVQLAAGAGATVYVLSRRLSAQKLALSLGATCALGTADWWSNARKVVQATERRGCERVIEATGRQFALSAATEMIAERGKLIIAGFHVDGPRQIDMQTWNWRGVDVINAHERKPERYVNGMKEGIEATIEGRITPERLITHGFRLQQLDQAFSMLENRPDGFVKAWVQP